MFSGDSAEWKNIEKCTLEPEYRPTKNLGILQKSEVSGTKSYINV